MRTRTALVFFALLIVAAPALAQPPGNSQAEGAANAAPRQPVFMSADKLTWTDLDPVGAPGVKVADLWGDHRKGAFGAFLKLPAGFVTPLHTHTHMMRVVFLSGTYIQAPEGKNGRAVRSGFSHDAARRDYWHTTSRDNASDYVFFVESDGASAQLNLNPPFFHSQ